MRLQPSVALAVALLLAGQIEAISLERLQTWVTKFNIVDVDFETPFKDPNSPQSLSFTAAGQDVTLDFKVSSGLFTSNAVGIPEGISSSLLTGTVRGQETDPLSYTTLTLWDDGVTGRFSRENKDGVHELSHIDKLDGTRSTVIYKDADIIGKPGTGEAPASLVARSLARRLRKRQAVTNTPATGKDCPIAIVADPTFQAKFGEDSVKQMASIMNDIQGIYIRAFNVGVPIALAVVDSNDTVRLGQNGVGATGDIAPALDLLAASVKDQKVLTADQQKDVCLTHMFTSREFGATLGLAFVGTLEVDSEGGICQGSSATGMTTTLAADKTDLPIAAMITTVAHELGHGFGSDHDEEIGCANQNFLMAAAVDVGGPPVSTFSDCSLRVINEVLGTKATCFKARQ